MIIEKRYASKQQHQLENFFRSQKNAVIIYRARLENRDQLSSEPSNSFEMEPESQKLILYFQNQAVEQILQLRLRDQEQVDKAQRYDTATQQRRFKVCSKFEDDEVEASKERRF